jgi:branched-chain amino acid transport system substrate-binding protein
VETGGTSWYFLTADYVFGHQLQEMTSKVIEQSHGKVLGASRYPFPGTSDFSSFLLTAQSSGAKVLGLANAGSDTINSIKQAHEFGLSNKMTVAALLMFITDVHGIGLPTAGGLYLTESFYWDMNDRTRAWAKRIQPKMPGNLIPNMSQAGDYASALHYLRAVQDFGPAKAVKDGPGVVARMKAMPTDDDCFGKRHIRADGLFITDSYLFRVKKPAESRGPWDYYALVGTTPAAEAFEAPAPACKLNSKA